MSEHAHLDPLAHVAQPDHPDAVAEARAEAGRAIRDLGHALVGHHAPVEVVQHITSTLDSLSAALDGGAPRTRAQQSLRGEWSNPPADGEAMSTYDERPVSGRSSPWGLDLEVRRRGDEVVAFVTFRAAHEGAPHRAHGGIVAALFDDVYGFVLSLQMQPAFTGELSVRYDAGVPIGVRLECRVRMESAEGRKLRMAGELLDGETVLARSTATFITIPRELFTTAGRD